MPGPRAGVAVCPFVRSIRPIGWKLDRAEGLVYSRHGPFPTRRGPGTLGRVQRSYSFSSRRPSRSRPLSAATTPCRSADSPPFAARPRPDNPLEADSASAQIQAGIDWSPSPIFLAHLHLLARTDDGQSLHGHAGTPEAYVEAHLPAGGSRVKLRARGVLPSHLARERGRPLGERVRDLLLGAQLVVRRGVPADRPGRRVAARGRRRSARPSSAATTPSVRCPWRRAGRCTTAGPCSDRRSTPRLTETFTLRSRRKAIIASDGRRARAGARISSPSSSPTSTTGRKGWSSATWTTGRRASRSSGSTTSGETGRSRARRAGARPRCSSREGASVSDLRASYLLVSRRLRRGRATARFDAFSDGESRRQALTLAAFWTPVPKLTVGIELSAGGGEQRAPRRSALPVLGPLRPPDRPRPAPAKRLRRW